MNTTSLKAYEANISAMLLTVSWIHLAIRPTVSFFFQAEDGIRDVAVTGVQTCALPISRCAATDYRECASGSRWRSSEPPPSFLADQTTDRTVARRHASRNVHHDRCQRASVLVDALAGNGLAVWSRANFSGFFTKSE